MEQAFRVWDGHGGTWPAMACMTSEQWCAFMLLTLLSYTQPTKDGRAELHVSILMERQDLADFRAECYAVLNATHPPSPAPPGGGP